MEGETQDVGSFKPGFTDEDFAEINAIINLATTSNFEEISEFYESSEGMNYANNAKDFGSLEKKMLNDDECASLLVENFSTREELLDRVRNMALKEGYVTTIKKSKPGCYVIIGCDRGGKYRGTNVPLNEGKRISGSRLVNCPFQMMGKKKVGAHAMLKRYLVISTGNFHEVREKICLAIENQHNEIKTKIASEKLRIVHKFRIPMFKELVTHVSIYALSELFKQYELATSSLLGPCRSQFSNTMGLPCAHFMQNMRGEPLLLSDIHPQWRIDIRSFNMDGGVNTNGSDIESLLKKFHDKYSVCLLVKEKIVTSKLLNLSMPKFH
ncbi:hypothetical protein Vadar_018096 [Vaccinium darrowii]|uniref:Uncharacterized protein n=1 Tax=Vaccinium darrowii TaxID=229202 RepID=A0ACB7ZCK2_9ERIC|nr:hypothetical protein Vadar_018096 [Vaccinium darrowii]